MINIILNHKIFQNDPPVLFDLGAGGDPKIDWKVFYKNSHIFKLDANDNIENSNNNKRQTLINETVFNKKTTKKFNLTRSIFCSSLLEPDKNELYNWIFKPKFDVKKRIKVKTTTLNEIINKKKIKHIDWIKLDLQGIDLRIFKSIPYNIRKNILVAEFEPGLYSFYKNEDKLSDVLKYMANEYLIDEFVFSSSIRSNSKFFGSLNFLNKRSINLINKKSKSYANICFLKKTNLINKKDIRGNLLLIAVLISKKRYIEALELISVNKTIDPIFKIIEKEILLKIKFGIFLYFLSRPYYLIKKIINVFIKNF